MKIYPKLNTKRFKKGSPVRHGSQFTPAPNLPSCVLRTVFTTSSGVVTKAASPPATAPQKAFVEGLYSFFGLMITFSES